MRFFFPDMLPADARRLVDAVRGGGLDTVENFSQLVKNGAPLIVFRFHLRLDEQVHVVGHDARGVNVVLAQTLSVQDAIHHEITFGR